MVIFSMLTVCGDVIRQYGNFDQNYNNFSKIVFSVQFYSGIHFCADILRAFLGIKNQPVQHRNSSFMSVYIRLQLQAWSYTLSSSFYNIIHTYTRGVVSRGTRMAPCQLSKKCKIRKRCSKSADRALFIIEKLGTSHARTLRAHASREEDSPAN